MLELFIKFRNSFVASTSDFWHHKVWKMSFGGCIANFMASGYHFKNGMFLAISKATLQKLVKSGMLEVLLKSTTPITHRVQAMLNFGRFELAKTGKNIGEWLEVGHTAVGCKAEYLGSHIVDGASNAQKSVKCLTWNTKASRSQMIIAGACDAHHADTAACQGSGTSKHKENLNPILGKVLHNFHLLITKLYTYKACQDVTRHVQQEHCREKFFKLLYSVVTRWNSAHDEAARINANQYDVEVAVLQIKAPGGADEKLRNQDEDTVATAVPAQDDWDMIHQYEGAMMPIKRYSTFSQSANVIAHEELFWVQSTIEQLRCSYFEMYENISKKVGPRGTKDLTVSILRSIVTDYTYDLTQFSILLVTETYFKPGCT